MAESKLEPETVEQRMARISHFCYFHGEHRNGYRVKVGDAPPKLECVSVEPPTKTKH